VKQMSEEEEGRRAKKDPLQRPGKLGEGGSSTQREAPRQGAAKLCGCVMW
jgi:hypothetical protein